MTLTEEESRELLESVRFLRQRSKEYFADFKMDEIPKRQKAYLPLILDWWDERSSRRTTFLSPILLTFIGPTVCGIVIAIIIKLFHL